MDLNQFYGSYNLGINANINSNFNAYFKTGIDTNGKIKLLSQLKYN